MWISLSLKRSFTSISEGENDLIDNETLSVNVGET